jgi:poly-gamma-glutamate synthesis protein (capsule biosynthesis protein)
MRRRRPELGRLTRRDFLALASTAALGGLAGTSRAAARAPEHTTLFLCGDVMTGRGLDQVLPHPGDPELREAHMRSALGYVALAERANGPIERPVPFAYPWGAALDELARAAPDARIVNLETSVTRASAWADKGIHYRMHPGNAGVLTAAGIDCCVLANNHVLDFGPAGLVETLDVLQAHGIATAGVGRDRAEAERPAVLELPAGRRVLVFAFGSVTSGVPRGWAAGEATPGVCVREDVRVSEVAARVRAVRQPGDVVVVSVHWGGNWGWEIPAQQRRLAHALIDEAGVDVVHGHSSHHVKGIEVHAGRPILYGCGDFLNDYEGIGGRAEYRGGLALMYLVGLDVAARRLARLELVPLRIARFRLERASPADRLWLRDTLNRECGQFGARVEPNGTGGLDLAWG